MKNFSFFLFTRWHGRDDILFLRWIINDVSLRRASSCINLHGIIYTTTARICGVLSPFGTFSHTVPYPEKYKTFNPFPFTS